MNIPLAGIILIMIVFLGGTIAIFAFIWAVRNKQFKNLNAGAYTIFDEEEPIGKMTDNTFGFPEEKELTKKRN